MGTSAQVARVDLGGAMTATSIDAVFALELRSLNLFLKPRSNHGSVLVNDDSKCSKSRQKIPQSPERLWGIDQNRQTVSISTR